MQLSVIKIYAKKDIDNFLPDADISHVLKSPIELLNDEGCDATKMPNDMLLTK